MFVCPDTTCKSCKSAGFLWRDSRFPVTEEVHNPLFVIFNEDGWFVSYVQIEFFKCFQTDRIQTCQFFKAVWRFFVYPLWSELKPGQENLLQLVCLWCRDYCKVNVSPKVFGRLNSFSQRHDVQYNEARIQSLHELLRSNFKGGWINHRKVIQFLVNLIFAILKVGQSLSMCPDNGYSNLFCELKTGGDTRYHLMQWYPVG